MLQERSKTDYTGEKGAIRWSAVLKWEKEEGPSITVGELAPQRAGTVIPSNRQEAGR